MKIGLVKLLRNTTLLLIVNHTGKAVFYVLSKDSLLNEDSPNYKNEVFKVSEEKDTVWVEQDYFVKPYSKKRNEILGDNGWTDFINRDCQDSTLYVFFFNAMDLVDTPWEELRSENRFVQLHRLKVEELEINNWNVVLE